MTMRCCGSPAPTARRRSKALHRHSGALAPASTRNKNAAVKAALSGHSWREILGAKRILLLIVAQRIGELVVILGDEIDIALVLDRGCRRLQRVVEFGERFLLVLGRNLFVGLDLGDLRLDDGFDPHLLLGR